MYTDGSAFAKCKNNANQVLPSKLSKSTVGGFRTQEKECLLVKVLNRNTSRLHLLLSIQMVDAHVRQRMFPGESVKSKCHTYYCYCGECQRRFTVCSDSWHDYKTKNVSW